MPAKPNQRASAGVPPALEEEASVGIQCTGRAINAAMKDDACNLRLGGFCTQQTFMPIHAHSYILMIDRELCS